MHDLIYDFPQAAYLLILVVPFMILYRQLIRFQQHSIHNYAPLPALNKLLLPRSSFFTLIKFIAINLSWIFACLAFMNPKGNLQYESSINANDSGQTQSTPILRHRPHTVIFLIDASASMSVADARGNQTRLAAAKEIIEEIISQLKGENVALYAFTSDLTPLVPPTLDHLFTRLVLKQLRINEGDIQGTNFKQILEALKLKLANKSSAQLDTVIILSDGGDNQIESLKGQAKKQAIQQLTEIIPNPKELNLRIFTVGMGSTKGGIIPHTTFNGQSVSSRLEEDVLKALANQERGAYYEANSLPVWNLTQDILNKMNQDSPYENEGLSMASSSANLARKVVPAKKNEMIYELYYQIPLGLAIVCLLIYFILPDAHRL